MSRYDVKIGDSVVSYGFDRPLNEYWAQIEGPADQAAIDRFGIEEDCVIRIGDTITRIEVGSLSGNYGSHGNLCEYLTQIGAWDLIPEEHRRAIMSDLTF